jgi:cell division protease FtsH
MSNEEDKDRLNRLKKQFSSGSPKKPGTGKGGGFNFFWIYGIIFLALVGINLVGAVSTSTRTSDFGEFQTLLREGDIKQVKIVNKETIQVYLNPESIKTKENLKEFRDPSFGGDVAKGPHLSFQMPYDAFNEQLQLIYTQQPELAESKPVILYEERKDYFSDILAWIIPLVLMIFIWLFIMRRMSGGGAGGGSQIFNIGKSRATLFDKDTNVKITFKDVAGLAGPKEEIQEIVSFLKNPGKYTDLGGKIPKGALLVGPPGTGKTLLAKAVAGEAKVPFFSLSGSDFVEMFVGVGASRVRDLFKQAKEKSPSIIFIDEIDAIGRARGKSVISGGNDERENTLNQLLTEMDGFNTGDHVIVIAATNRADILDRALMRAGRFDRLIYIDLPDLNERKEVFQVHLKPLKLAKEIDVDFLAKQTPGFSGADIANVCNEAALIAARKDKKQIEKQDFLDAVDRIVGGLEKKSKIITPEEKKVIAFHEAGHATVSWMLEHAAPLVKVTIVPRGKSLGAAWYLPDERQITTAEQLNDEICSALGGRAAEQVIFNKISTGALSDLEKVTKQAQAMVTIYGLNPELGHITYYDSSGQSDYNFSKPYSEKTAQKIDEEIKKIIDLQYERAVTLLTKEQEKLTILANQLLEKEVIFKEDLVQIFGARPWTTREETMEAANNAAQNREIQELEPEKTTEQAEAETT